MGEKIPPPQKQPIYRSMHRLIGDLPGGFQEHFLGNAMREGNLVPDFEKSYEVLGSEGHRGRRGVRRISIAKESGWHEVPS